MPLDLHDWCWFVALKSHSEIPSFTCMWQLVLALSSHRVLCRCFLHLLHRPCCQIRWAEVGHDPGWSFLLCRRHLVCFCSGPGHAHYWPCLPWCWCRVCQPGTVLFMQDICNTFCIFAFAHAHISAAGMSCCLPHYCLTCSLICITVWGSACCRMTMNFVIMSHKCGTVSSLYCIANEHLLTV